MGEHIHIAGGCRVLGAFLNLLLPLPTQNAGDTHAMRKSWLTSTCCRPQADEGPEHFWGFIEGWVARGSDAPAGSCWGDILAAARARTSMALGSLLPLVLASRKYSPRLELFATLAAERASYKVGRCRQIPSSRLAVESCWPHQTRVGGLWLCSCRCGMLFPMLTFCLFADEVHLHTCRRPVAGWMSTDVSAPPPTSCTRC